MPKPSKRKLNLTRDMVLNSGERVRSVVPLSEDVNLFLIDLGAMYIDTFQIRVIRMSAFECETIYCTAPFSSKVEGLTYEQCVEAMKRYDKYLENQKANDI